MIGINLFITDDWLYGLAVVSSLVFLLLFVTTSVLIKYICFIRHSDKQIFAGHHLIQLISIIVLFDIFKLLNSEMLEIGFHDFFFFYTKLHIFTLTADI